MKIVNETSYHDDTPDAVIKILENSRETCSRIRLVYGNTDTGLSWHATYEVTGRVVRSTGTCKIPLMIATHRSYGGPGILDHCILGIRTTRKPYKWLYRHPLYKDEE